jgi:hypothetical protein
MEQDTHYSYDSIRPDQMRLCRFVKDGDYLSAVLETFSTTEPHPRYTALSYAWSLDQHSAKISWVIRIGEQYLPALDSLRPFVQTLRSGGSLLDGTWWWIDSICIDQKNNKEKAEHVRRMQYLYRDAHNVIVWLGEQSEDSDCAINFIHLLEETNRAGISTAAIRTMFQEDRYQERWTALKTFFLRRWWTRVWTVQESVIPSSISFWCGLRQVSRDSMFTALYVADRCNSAQFKRSIAFHHAWNRSRAWLLHKSGEGFSFSPLALAAYFCNNHATDDRDRLYGLIALANENHGLEVNYSNTTDEVYIHFSQSFIERHKSLDIVCFASLFVPTHTASLPSWVPDWRRRAKPHVIPLMASQSSTHFVGNLRPPQSMAHGDKSTRYSASGSRAASYKFDGLALLAHGYIIDTVDGLAASRKLAYVQSSWQHSRTPSTARLSIELLTSICRCLVLNREDRYLRFSMPTEQFSHDFTQLCLHVISGSQEPSLEVLRNWFESSQQLLIHGNTLEQIVRNVQKNPVDALVHPAPIQDAYIHDSFYGRFCDTIGPMSLRFMTSREGRIGMVSERAMKGDLICILFGCNVPVVLRRKRNKDELALVSECFLDECMQGEALDQCELLEREFRIT